MGHVGNPSPVFFDVALALTQVFERLKYSGTSSSTSAAGAGNRKHVLNGISVCRSAVKTILGIGVLR